MDDRNLAAYLPIRCVFDKACFPEEYRYEILQISYLYDEQAVKDKLRYVFFKFTDTIILMLKDGAFDDIIEAYYSYGDY